MNIGVTKDKRRLLITEMENSHILNAIKMLNRQFDILMLYQIESYPQPQGEFAQMAWENEIAMKAEDGPSSIWPVYDSLYAEACKRNIL